MLLSVIIPLFNAEKYIDKCIDSIIGQGLYDKDYEIIVIDDGSNDNSPNIVNGFMKRFKNIRLIKQANCGVCSSRSIGFEVASGDWVHLVDNDNVIPPGAYRKIINLSSDRLLHGVDVISFKTATFVEGKLVNSIIPTELITFDGTFQDYVESNGFRSPVCGYWIRRDFLNENHLFFENVAYGEDVLFNLNLFHHYNGKILC